MRMSVNSSSIRDQFIRGLVRQKTGEASDASGMPLLCEKDSVYVDPGDRHTLIFGNTGTKKTRNFIIPTVYMLGNAGESMVVTDPKGEIYAASSGFLSREGYHISVLNLRDLPESDQWNPLAVPYYFYCHGGKDRAMEMVADLSRQLTVNAQDKRDPYWENVAASTLEGLILLLFEYGGGAQNITMGNILRLRQMIEAEPDPNDLSKAFPETAKGKFWKIMDLLPESSMIRMKMGNVIALRNTDGTLNGILTVLDQMLSVFGINRELLRMVDGNTIDMDQVGFRKTAFFLIVPDEKTTFHFLASVFIKQLYEIQIYKAQLQEKRGLPIRVNFVLDEFANLTKIQDMSSMISAARSRNIRFMLVVQSKAQLYGMYGGAEAETIKSNCATWIVLPCRELSLLKEISSLCGNVRDENGGKRAAFSINSLQRLSVGWDDGQALVLLRGKDPYVAWVRDYTSYPQSRWPEAVRPENGERQEHILQPGYLLINLYSGQYRRKRRESLFRLSGDSPDVSCIEDFLLYTAMHMNPTFPSKGKGETLYVLAKACLAEAPGRFPPGEILDWSLPKDVYSLRILWHSADFYRMHWRADVALQDYADAWNVNFEQAKLTFEEMDRLGTSYAELSLQEGKAKEAADVYLQMISFCMKGSASVWKVQSRKSSLSREGLFRKYMRGFREAVIREKGEKGWKNFLELFLMIAPLMDDGKKYCKIAESLQRELPDAGKKDQSRQAEGISRQPDLSGGSDDSNKQSEGQGGQPDHINGSVDMENHINGSRDMESLGKEDPAVRTKKMKMADVCASSNFRDDWIMALHLYHQLFSYWKELYQPFVISNSFSKAWGPPAALIRREPYEILMKELRVLEKLSIMQACYSPESAESREREEAEQMMTEMLSYLFPYDRKDFKALCAECLEFLWNYYTHLSAIVMDTEYADSKLSMLQGMAGMDDGGYDELIAVFLALHGSWEREHKKRPKC